MQYYQYMWNKRSGVIGSLIDLVGEGDHTEVTKKKNAKKDKFYWEPVGPLVPSCKILNAIVTFSNSFAISFVPFLAYRARACSTVLWASMSNLWLFFKFLAC